MSSQEVTLPPRPPANHGHTRAAWVTMIGLMIAALLVALGLVFKVMVLCYIGAGVVLVSLLAGKALRALGFGQPLSSS